MVGKLIVKLRKEKGWTQSDLAKATGLSKGYIAAIEEGRDPGVKALSIIAVALGVEIGALYKEEE